MLIAVLFGLFVTPAKAAVYGSNPQANNYGPWLPDPGSPGSANYYQVDLAPLSSQANPEITDFGCNYSGEGANGQGFGTYKGFPIPRNTITYIKTKFAAMRAAYNDALSSGKIYAGDESLGGPYPSLTSYQTRKSVLATKQLQLQLAWVKRIDMPQVLGTAQGAAAANLLPDSGTISNPSQLATYVPVGCDLGEFDSLTSTDNMGFGTLVSNPAKWLTSVILYIPGQIAVGGYKTVEPWALAYTFWTPHSERGDLMFYSAGFSCKGGQSPGAAAVNCSADGSPLGYNAKNAQQGHRPPIWVRLAMFFTWLLSATYFIILAGGAIIYMSRANHKSSFTIVQLIPRLILSMLLTIFLTYLMGVAITLSNTIIQMLFGMNDIGSIRGIHQVFFTMGDMFNGNALSAVGDFTAGMMEIGLLAVAGYYLLRFILFSLWRQIALVVLIVIAPFACFCIITPRLQEHFNKWMRAFVVLISAPLVMALILKLGLAINPAIILYNNGGYAGSSVINNSATAFLGALMLIITFHMMARIPKIAKAAIKGKPIGAGLLGKMGSLGKTAGSLVMPFNPAIGAALMAGGAAAGGVGNASAGVSRGMAKLIPNAKVRATTTAPPAAKRGMSSRILEAEVVGEVAGGFGTKALGYGAGKMAGGGAGATTGGAAGGAAAGGLLGKAKALGAKALGSGSFAVGAAALMATHNNPRTKEKMAQHVQLVHAEHGLKKVEINVAMRLMNNQVKAVADGRAKYGANFDEDRFLHEVYWAKSGHKPSGTFKDEKPMARPRLIKKGMGPYAQWYAVSSSSPESPLAAPGRPAGPKPPRNTQPDFEPDRATSDERRSARNRPRT